jgi:hypothetical protein
LTNPQDPPHLELDDLPKGRRRGLHMHQLARSDRITANQQALSEDTELHDPWSEILESCPQLAQHLAKARVSSVEGTEAGRSHWTYVPFALGVVKLDQYVGIACYPRRV